MAGVRRIFLLFLLFYVICSYGTDGRSRGGSRGGSRSHSSSHSSHHSSYSRPSYSRPSYPHSSGLSGSGGSKPSYPSSSGLSGYGGSKPSYPPSGGLSGYGGSKPSYPPSSGLSGNSRPKPSYPPSSPRPYYPPSSPRPYYPPSTSKSYYQPSYDSSWSNNHNSYDNSWSSHHNSYQPSQNYDLKPLPQGVYNTWEKYHPTTQKPYISYTKKPTTTVHHHHHYHDTHHYYDGYRYHPPTRVYYTNTYRGTSTAYPVYTGELPTYVYQYRTSQNKFSELLAGLALYNLGISHGNAHMHHFYKHYTPETGEKCTFGVKNPNYNRFSYDSYEYEEVRVDCRLISSFIWNWKQENPTVMTNTTTIVTNTTTTIVTSKGNGQVLNPNGTIANGQNGNTNVTVPSLSRTLLNEADIKPSTNTSSVNATISVANISSSVPIVNVTTSAPVVNVNNSILTNNITSEIINNITASNIISTNNTNAQESHSATVPTIQESNSSFITANTSTVSTSTVSTTTSLPIVLSSNETLLETTPDKNVSKPLVIKAENLVKPPFESMSQTILENGTLVEETKNITTTTKTSTVLVTHLTDSKLNGNPVEVSNGMECYVTRATPTSKMRKTVDCGLLQTYSESSLKKGSAINISPSVVMILVSVITMLFVY